MLVSSSLFLVSMLGSTPTSMPITLILFFEHSLTYSSLQYQNRKPEYFKAIWEVINWKAMEKRFS